MGEIAAQTILRRITQPAEENENAPTEVIVQPELIVRETTGTARLRSKSQSELRQQQQ
jgi:DNA-binding LacI/PurR family transcriptional regulator